MRPQEPRPIACESGRSSRVQEPDDRTDPTVVVVRLVQVQFGENAGTVAVQNLCRTADLAQSADGDVRSNAYRSINRELV